MDGSYLLPWSPFFLSLMPYKTCHQALHSYSGDVVRSRNQAINTAASFVLNGKVEKKMELMQSRCGAEFRRPFFPFSVG